MKEYNGYYVSEYMDVNVYSPTYGKTKKTMVYDTVKCPKTQIEKNTQTITWSQSISDMTVGDTVELSATASSGLDVSFAVYSGGEYAHIDGNTLYADAEGYIVVVAKQDGNEQYYGAESISKSITIKAAVTPKKTQTITWSQSLPYKLTNGDTVELSATASSGLDVTFNITQGSERATLSGNQLTCKSYGIISITALQEGNNEYEAAESIVKRFFIVLKDYRTTNSGKLHIDFNSDSEYAYIDGQTYGITVSLPIDGTYTTLFETDDILSYARTHNYSVDIEFTNLSGIINYQAIKYDGLGNEAIKRMFIKPSPLSYHYDCSNIVNFADIWANQTNANNFANVSGGLTNTNTIKSFANLYYNCQTINTILLPFDNITGALSYANMFYNCYKLHNIVLTGLGLNTNADTTDMFKNCGRDCDSVIIDMLYATAEEQAFIKQAWIDSGNDENKLTIVTEE